MIIVQRYNITYASIWDEFVDASKNGTFMIKRGYMDYHADRFVDHSLLFYVDDKLMALLPASQHETELCSHGGLTYGGMVITEKMTMQIMLELFEGLRNYMYEQRITKLIYKRVPSIYYTYPSDEDLYALFRVNAKLIQRDISTTIYQPAKLRFTERRRRGLKQAMKKGVVVRESIDYESYIEILSNALLRHNVKPAHTATEIRLLASRFPDNIKLFAAYLDEKMLAGVLVYLTPRVAHTQYIANSDEGRSCGALDAVMDFLINENCVNQVYFDFGISTEDKGRFLNEGLITQKQEFGGRAIIYDKYEIGWNDTSVSI